MLTTQEVAELTGIAPRTIQDRAKKEKIGRHAGRDWRFTDRDLQRLKDGKRDRPGRPKKAV